MKTKFVKGIQIYGVTYFGVERVVEGRPHIAETRIYKIPQELKKGGKRIERLKLVLRGHYHGWMIGRDLRNKWIEHVTKVSDANT